MTFMVDSENLSTQNLTYVTSFLIDQNIYPVIHVGDATAWQAPQDVPPSLHPQHVLSSWSAFLRCYQLTV